MAEGSVQGTSVASSWKRMQKFVSGSAAVALLSGMLVVAGIGVQSAVAAGDPAPKVTATVANTPLWGEDVTVDLAIQSPFKAGQSGAKDAFNLSIGVVLPKGVTLQGKSTLGVPTIFPVSEDDRVVPGAYAKFPTDCVSFGLEPVQGKANSCQVPEGMQYAVFTNVSDLPAGANTEHTIQVRPDATMFPIGSKLNATISAFTSNNATLIPIFPGVKSVSKTQSHTSEAAFVTLEAPVKGLRVTKTETVHPENKVLRGVHGDNGTIYKLTIDHTGEADLDDAVVVDFLPAGLEYLGSCGIDDHTSNANGTRNDSAEYPGALELNTASVGENCLKESSVETILMDADTAALYKNSNSQLEVGKVYTKVTWNIPEDIWNSTSTDAGAKPAAQGEHASSEGFAASTVIRYRAGVPLFENTLDFGGETPAAESGAQGANLDNNRGASTHHGNVDPTDAEADKGNGAPKSYTNVAVAKGTYQGKDETTDTSDANGTTITAVDLRVVKSVDNAEFTQGGFARYTLKLSTSEYTSAEVPSPGAAPYRLLDDFADGLCPVFPANVPVAHDAKNPESSDKKPVPNLVLGKPNGKDAKPFQTVEAWNNALADAGLDTACAWNPSKSNTQPDSTQLAGAKLSTLGFDANSGHFYLELAVDPALLDANSRDRIVQYSAQQGVAYVKGSAEGATTSGDTVHNTVDIFGKTTSIPALDGVTSAGSTTEGNKVSGDVADGVWNVADQSSATLKANYTKISKTVLEREAGTPSVSDIANFGKAGSEDAKHWVKKARTPFAPGDEVWYRVQITPPSGTDVRNPKFTDFLPEGVSFDAKTLDSDGRSANIRIVPASPKADIGTCHPKTERDWVNTFAPANGIDVSGNVLTFNLGANCGLGGPDRFLPLNSQLEIYLKVKITSISAFGEADLPQNLAKYQQNNVDGEIYFLRDEAEITLDSSARLVKGIESNSFVDRQNAAGSVLNAPNSNVDGQTIAQGDKVTFRLDVTVPTADTTGYVIYDALPLGVKAENLAGYNKADATFTGRSTLWADNTDLPDSSVGYKAYVYNPGDDSYPKDLNPFYKDRSIVVWVLNGTVPGSSLEVPAVPADPKDSESVETPAKPAVQRGFSVKYTVIVPGAEAGTGAAQITQDYVNTASIAEMAVINDAETHLTTSLVPTVGAGGTKVATGGSTLNKAGETAQPVSARKATANQMEISAELATDPSNVTLPDAKVSKKLVSTEIKPVGSAVADQFNSSQKDGLVANRADDAIVEGEYATFEYAVTVPAKTSVANGSLYDGGKFVVGNQSLDYEFVPGSAKFYKGATGDTEIVCGTTATDFKCDSATGELTLPEFYTNNTGENEIFRVQIQVWVKQGKNSVTLRDGNTLVNTANFAYNKPGVGIGKPLTATASVNYLEPAPKLTKTTSGIQGADKKVTFTLTARNEGMRPALYDAVVYDCLPAGFSLPEQVFAPSSGTVDPVTPAVKCSATGSGGSSKVVHPDSTGTGTLIKWNVGRLDGNGSATLTFDAIVDAKAAGSQVYTNKAQLDGRTLPAAVDRSGKLSAGASANVTIKAATVAKSVSPENAPVGSTVDYTLTTKIPANANFFFFDVTDVLPVGVEFVPGSANLTFEGGPELDAQPVLSENNRKLTWSSGGNKVTVSKSESERTLLITYKAKITDKVTAAALVNTVTVKWNTNSATDATATQKTATSNATVTVQNPFLTLQKQVKLQSGAESTYATSASGNPDETFTYRILVENNGPTEAFHAAITDCLPAGVVGVTDVSANGSYSETPAAGCANGTITWTNLKVPAKDAKGNKGKVLLSYSASFASSDALNSATPLEKGRGVALRNTAKVVKYSSYDADGWVYLPGESGTPGNSTKLAKQTSSADVTPLFPNVVPHKTVTNPVKGTEYGLAYPGEKFNWTLTLTNQGAGTAENISVTDLLPLNWEYVGNARITGGGQNGVALIGEPKITTERVSRGTQQTVTWENLHVPGTGIASLPTGESFVITFDATPTQAAIDAPGTGVKVNAHTNTLRVTATDTTGSTHNKNVNSYVGPESQATAYIARADLKLTKTAVPTQPVVAGTATPFDAWKLVVTNDGPDTAEGPITVKDTTGPLPAGVTITSAGGEGWTCTVGERAKNGATAIDCARNERSQSLQSGTSFPAIIVRATVAPSQLATTVTNSAIVIPGKTYDPNYIADPKDPGYDKQNNRSEASFTTTTAADLALMKSVTSPASIPEKGIVVGSNITWEFKVSNLGPSDSLSTSDQPITITDRIPADITNIADPTNNSWKASIERDGKPAEFPAKSGDLITLTFRGDSIPFNTESRIAFTGTILTSHVGDIANTARVNPGVTPEPPSAGRPDNNTSSTDTPTNSTTEIAVRKARVVADASVDGGWRQADPQGDPFVAGEPVFYRVTVENRGNADARNVHVVDKAPAGLTFKSSSNVSGNWTAEAVSGTNNHDFTLEGGSIPVGENRAFVVVYDTASTLTDEVVNVVVAYADNADEATASDRTGATKIVDLGITKSHDGTGPFTPGTTVQYTLTVTNHGPSSTNGGIEIVDNLPVGLSYVPGSATATSTAASRAALSAEPALSGEGDRTLTWNLLEAGDVLDIGQTITITIDALIDPSLRTGTELVNRASVSGPHEQTEPDPDPNPNWARDVITTTGTTAAMTVQKFVQESGDWVETTEVVAGTTAKWRVIVTNEGPSAAPVSFTDTLPAGASFVSVAGDGWDCPVVDGVPTGSCVYTANNGLHPVGEANATVIEIETLMAAQLRPTQLPTIAPLVNTATINWTDDTTGAQTANDTASVTIANEADLSIVKSVIDKAEGSVLDEPASVVAGTSVWYRLQVTNAGPSDASGPLVITDTLPDDFSVASGESTINGWTMEAEAFVPGTQQVVTFTREGGQVAATAADAARGNAPVIEFEVNIDSAIAHGTSATNTASVTSATTDPNLDNNTDTAEVTVHRDADLWITKSHPVADDRGRVVIGDALPFTIKVANEGPSVSSGFTVTDTMPIGFEVTDQLGAVLDEQGDPTGWTIESITPEQWDATQPTVVVASYVGVTEVGAKVPPLVLNTMVHESAFSEAGGVKNHVAITDANETDSDSATDPDTQQNEYDDPIDVRPLVTLVIKKQAVGEFKVGKIGTYQITVENQGSQPDHGPITVTDQLPAGLSFRAAPDLPEGAVVAHENGVVKWTLSEPLPAGEKVTLTLQVNVLAAAYKQPNHQVVNVASVDTESTLSDDSVLTDAAIVTVKPADPLVNTGGEIAGGLLAAIALMGLLGGASYLAGRKRTRARHA